MIQKLLNFENSTVDKKLVQTAFFNNQKLWKCRIKNLTVLESAHFMPAFSTY